MNKNVKLMLNALTFALGFASISGMVYASAPAALCRSEMAKLRAQRDAHIAGIRQQKEELKKELRVLQALQVRSKEERDRILFLQGRIKAYQDEIKNLQK